MTEPEESTLNILLREVLELKEAVNQLKYNKELIDRQFRDVAEIRQGATSRNNWLEVANIRAREITESGWG